MYQSELIKKICAIKDNIVDSKLTDLDLPYLEGMPDG